MRNSHLNKCLQVQMARDAGFDVPKTLVARTAADVRKFGATESFPIILKAAECVPTTQGRVEGCRKWICANPDELETAVAEWAERVPLASTAFRRAGPGEGVFGLAAPMESGHGVRTAD